MSHQAVEGAPLEVRAKITGRPEGWFAACECSWTGPARDRPGLALVDFQQHLNENRQTEE